MTDFHSQDVQAVFSAYPAQYREPLLALRALIFAVAARTAGVGPVTETLKWGQPSYLTEVTNAGTTIRLDRLGEQQIAIFFHCQTLVIDQCRGMFPSLTYSKNRAIVLNPEAPLPLDDLAACIELALTYKLRKHDQTSRLPASI